MLHITKDQKPTAWCGEHIGLLTRCYTTVDNALKAILAGTSEPPCQQCLAKIQEVLAEVISVSPDVVKSRPEWRMPASPLCSCDMPSVKPYAYLDGEGWWLYFFCEGCHDTVDEIEWPFRQTEVVEFASLEELGFINAD